MKLSASSPKQKKCKVCRTEFVPRTSTQVVCSYQCSHVHVDELKAKKAASEAKASRVEHRAAKEQQKSRADWIKEVQVVVNTYCRLRDLQAGHGCIDCGKPFEPQKPGGSVDAGHYLSRGSHPNLRFNILNIHAQRKNCNRPGGTTAAAFRLGMIGRIGLEAVDALEADHTPAKWTIEELRAMKSHYAKLVSELKKLSDL
jgi:hypothetical protein